jgi:hypothetical protein
LKICIFAVIKKLDMFGIGGGDSFIMFIVPHVGSDKVPEIIRTMGKAMATKNATQ